MDCYEAEEVKTVKLMKNTLKNNQQQASSENHLRVKLPFLY